MGHSFQLKKPLAFFDLETTGTVPSRDRIVEIAIIKALPGGEEERYRKLINPEVPIPQETTDIHGIAEADIADAPTFRQVGKEIAQFLSGCDLSGFNILRFDLPLLVEEFLRADIEFDIKNRKVVDAQKIFFMMEPRNLSAALRFYCDEELSGAHSAEADTEASLKVLQAQIGRYKGQQAQTPQGQVLGTIENDMAALHALTTTQLVDLAGRFAYDRDGKEVFAFGKHRNKRVEDVLQKEPSYYDWMMKGDFPLDTKRRLTEIKLRMGSFGQ